MYENRLAYLFNKYYQKTTTVEEEAEFLQLAAKGENVAELRVLLGEAWAESDERPIFTEAESNDMLLNIFEASTRARREQTGSADLNSNDLNR